MNQIPKILPNNVKQLFRRIENDLDTELYFYGSVTRSDYIPNKSDIDVAIFSDNEYSDMIKLQNILVVNRKDFDKVVWKLNGQMIYGYKVKIRDINCELSIFNSDFKNVLLDEYTKPNKNQSIIIGFLIYVLKLLYYQIPILPKKVYVELKRYIMNELIDKKETVYYLVKEEEKTT